MRVTILCGGVGGARFTRSFSHWAERTGWEGELTALVNVGDDFTHLGLRVSPDIDSVTYHLAGLGDDARGWGRGGDTDTAITEITRVLPQEGWFQLGDLDIAHNLMRTHLLGQGHSLSRVTAELAGRYGVDCRILPVTDDPSPTRVRLSEPLPGVDGTEPLELGFQEWWVREQATPVPDRFVFPLAGAASPAPGVLQALDEADLVVIAPSNPAVSIAPILAIPGVREALTGVAAPVIGLSPIIGGKPVRGWADRCLRVLGVPCTAAGVAEHYGARAAGGLLDGWLIDDVDAEDCRELEPATASSPLIFQGTPEDDHIITAALELADRCRTSFSG